MFGGRALAVGAVAIALWGSACSAAHDPETSGDATLPDIGVVMTDAGVDSAPGVDGALDAGELGDANGVDAAGVLSVAADMPMLEARNCHHGCAPGIDGTFALEVSNADLVAHVLLVTEVSFRPVGSPGGPFVAPGNGWFRVMGAAADGSVSIGAGEMQSLTVMVYLDLPMLFPGTYEIRTRVLVDGAETVVVLPAAFVPMGMGCP